MVTGLCTLAVGLVMAFYSSLAGSAFDMGVVENIGTGLVLIGVSVAIVGFLRTA